MNLPESSVSGLACRGQRPGPHGDPWASPPLAIPGVGASRDLDSEVLSSVLRLTRQSRGVSLADMPQSIISPALRDAYLASGCGTARIHRDRAASEAAVLLG